MRNFIKKKIFGILFIIWSILNFGLFIIPFVNENPGSPQGNMINGYQILTYIGDPSGVISALAIMQVIFLAFNILILLFGLSLLLFFQNNKITKHKTLLLTQLIFVIIIMLLSVFILLYVPNVKDDRIIAGWFPMAIIGFYLTFWINIFVSFGLVIVSILSLKKISS